MMNGLMLLAAAVGTLGLLLMLAAIVALTRRHPGSMIARLFASLICLGAGALLALAALASVGYRALTHEVVAATIEIEPLGPQRFRARVRLPDGPARDYELAGDEIYVDARILKWRPIANLVGLHTAYELDRVAGRYAGVEEERTRPRTDFALGEPKPLDPFALRRRYALLAPLLDVEYGSASFVPAAAHRIEVRVSTTGLLIREAPPQR